MTIYIRQKMFYFIKLKSDPFVMCLDNKICLNCTLGPKPFFHFFTDIYIIHYHTQADIGVEFIVPSSGPVREGHLYLYQTNDCMD